jgi:hypothetical protein
MQNICSMNGVLARQWHVSCFVSWHLSFGTMYCIFLPTGIGNSPSGVCILRIVSRPTGKTCAGICRLQLDPTLQCRWARAPIASFPKEVEEKKTTKENEEEERKTCCAPVLPPDNREKQKDPSTRKWRRQKHPGQQACYISPANPGPFSQSSFKALAWFLFTARPPSPSASVCPWKPFFSNSASQSRSCCSVMPPAGISSPVPLPPSEGDEAVSVGEAVS